MSQKANPIAPRLGLSHLWLDQTVSRGQNESRRVNNEDKTIEKIVVEILRAHRIWASDIVVERNHTSLGTPRINPLLSSVAPLWCVDGAHSHKISKLVKSAPVTTAPAKHGPLRSRGKRLLISLPTSGFSKITEKKPPLAPLSSKITEKKPPLAPLTVSPSSKTTEKRLPLTSKTIEKRLPLITPSEAIEKRLPLAPLSSKITEKRLPLAPLSSKIIEKRPPLTPASSKTVENKLPLTPSSKAIEKRPPLVPSSKIVEKRPPVSYKMTEKRLPLIPSTASLFRGSSKTVEKKSPLTPASKTVEKRPPLTPPFSSKITEKRLPSSKKITKASFHTASYRAEPPSDAPLRIRAPQMRKPYIKKQRQTTPSEKTISDRIAALYKYRNKYKVTRRLLPPLLQGQRDRAASEYRVLAKLNSRRPVKSLFRAPLGGLRTSSAAALKFKQRWIRESHWWKKYFKDKYRIKSRRQWFKRSALHGLELEDKVIWQKIKHPRKKYGYFFWKLKKRKETAERRAQGLLTSKVTKKRPPLTPASSKVIEKRLSLNSSSKTTEKRLLLTPISSKITEKRLPLTPISSKTIEKRLPLTPLSSKTTENKLPLRGPSKTVEKKPAIDHPFSKTIEKRDSLSNKKPLPILPFSKTTEKRLPIAPLAPLSLSKRVIVKKPEITSSAGHIPLSEAIKKSKAGVAKRYNSTYAANSASPLGPLSPLPPKGAPYPCLAGRPEDGGVGSRELSTIKIKAAVCIIPRPAKKWRRKKRLQAELLSKAKRRIIIGRQIRRAALLRAKKSQLKNVMKIITRLIQLVEGKNIQVSYQWEKIRTPYNNVNMLSNWASTALTLTRNKQLTAEKPIKARTAKRISKAPILPYYVALKKVNKNVRKTLNRNYKNRRWLRRKSLAPSKRYSSKRTLAKLRKSTIMLSLLNRKLRSPSKYKKNWLSIRQIKQKRPKSSLQRLKKRALLPLKKLPDSSKIVQNTREVQSKPDYQYNISPPSKTGESTEHVWRHYPPLGNVLKKTSFGMRAGKSTNRRSEPPSTDKVAAHNKPPMKPLKGQGGAYKATINQSNYKEASYSQTGKVATPPSTKPHSGKVDPFLRRGVESANSHNKKAYSKGEPNKREPYARESYNPYKAGAVRSVNSPCPLPPFGGRLKDGGPLTPPCPSDTPKGWRGGPTK